MDSRKKIHSSGLSYVAAALEKAGFEVQVIDNYLLEKPVDQVKLEVEKLNPETVGITCSPQLIAAVLRLRKPSKMRFPHARSWLADGILLMSLKACLSIRR